MHQISLWFPKILKAIMNKYFISTTLLLKHKELIYYIYSLSTMKRFIVSTLVEKGSGLVLSNDNRI